MVQHVNTNHTGLMPVCRVAHIANIWNVQFRLKIDTTNMTINAVIAFRRI